MHFKMGSVKYVVTGRSGSGKSTLLRGLALFAEDLGLPYFAIFTPEVRKGKRRAGFAIETVDFDPQRATSLANGETQSTKISKYKQFSHILALVQHPLPADTQLLEPQTTEAKLAELKIPETDAPTIQPDEAGKRVGRYVVDPSVVRDLIVTPLRSKLNGGHNPLIFVDEVGPMQLTHAPLRDAIRDLLNAKGTAFIALADAVDAAIKDEIREHPNIEMFTLTKENRDALLNTCIAQLVDIAAGE